MKKTDRQIVEELIEWLKEGGKSLEDSAVLGFLEAKLSDLGDAITVKHALDGLTILREAAEGTRIVLERIRSSAK